MRILFKKDKKITEEELNELQRQFIDLYYEHAQIVPEFFVEEIDATNIPTEPDSDGDLKPTKRWTTALVDDIYKRYKEFGTDHIVLLVHEDNWKFKGIWGTNWSNIYHSYHFELCRFDRDNIANSLGTLYHEIHHSHDALIKTTLGIDIGPILEVNNYDKGITHGGETPWKYIRWKENTDSLRIMAPYLQQSYKKRRELHEEVLGLMKKVIQTAQTLIVLLRSAINKKDGVPR